MTKLLNGAELNKLLEKTITSDCSVRMAVAFWGTGAKKQLNLSGNLNAKLICNLTTGGTNPHEIESMIESSLDVKMHNKLHAKIGLIGDDFSFVGSSNMSANGLGFEGGELDGWEEANVVFEGTNTDISSRFDELWKQSKKIKKEHLKKAKEAWNQRRAMTIEQQPEEDAGIKSLWDTITNRPEDLNATPLHIAYYYELDDAGIKEIEEAQEEVKKEYGKQSHVFLEWPKLPVGYIISVCRSNKRTRGLKDVEYFGRSLGAPFFTVKKQKYLVVENKKSIPGFAPLKNGDLTKFKELILAFIDTKDDPQKSREISIQELMRFQGNRQDE